MRKGEEEKEKEEGSLPMAGGAEAEPCEPGSRVEPGGRCQEETGWMEVPTEHKHIQKMQKHPTAPQGLVLELSNAHYLKRERSPQNLIPSPPTRGPG